MHMTMKICCSMDSYDAFKMFHDQSDAIYACAMDLSYGNLSTKEIVFLHEDETLTIAEFQELLQKEKQIEIWFNSKDACEFCNFLYLMTILPQLEILYLDTGISLSVDEGCISVGTTYMVPLNYLERYKQSIQKLHCDKRDKWKLEWEKICKADKQLRYVEHGCIHSVNEDYFDRLLESKETLFHQYGVSEEWLMERKKYIVIKDKG